MKSLLVSAGLSLLLGGTALFLTFTYLGDQRPGEMLDDLYTSGTLVLFKHGLIEDLSSGEITQLYQSSCNRKCHSKDVIEKHPRTSLEWEWIVTRMQAPDRAGINDRETAVITRYLQEHFLSNIPTIMPEKTMRFVKRHLWRSDFGESDLYLDIIYIPRLHLSLLPYLVASNSPPKGGGAVFVVFVNTHQGTIPPWDLSKMAIFQNGDGGSQKAIGWKLIYEDGQGHHKQGILTFPAIADSQPAALEVAIRLPGMRERIFQWDLPIPAFTAKSDDDV